MRYRDDKLCRRLINSCLASHWCATVCCCCWLLFGDLTYKQVHKQSVGLNRLNSIDLSLRTFSTPNKFLFSLCPCVRNFHSIASIDWNVVCYSTFTINQQLKVGTSDSSIAIEVAIDVPNLIMNTWNFISNITTKWNSLSHSFPGRFFFHFAVCGLLVDEKEEFSSHIEWMFILITGDVKYLS